jgi:hypothetical protein
MASASKRPEGSTDRPKNDGHLRYIEVTEAFNTRLTELATRRALAQEKDARISTFLLMYEGAGHVGVGAEVVEGRGCQ